ncbi:nSTAND1 domain-containing NTPase [Nonomuraea rubra]|uniref:nSTAND1 domain-containing NTPase n=1 Tax=Nonomuraea rubra TaxID=46180 RepID=UPI003409CE12
MPAPDFTGAVARVWGMGAEPVGSAFLIGPRTLLTCTHVLAHTRGTRRRRPTLPREGWEVEVDFPQAGGGLLRAHAVVVEPADGLYGDISVLELDGETPPGLGRLVLHPLDDLQGRDCRTFGYPADFPDGASAQGRLRGMVGDGWLELVTEEVEPGFSGAPVWVEDLSGVVGMVVARHGPGRAYAIPVRSLFDAHPPLREMALPPSPFRGLRPFEQGDARVFAGRDDLAGEVADLARRHALTVVYGASGVGKTSLVRGGVLPRLSALGFATSAVRLHPRVDLAAEIVRGLLIGGEPASDQGRAEPAGTLGPAALADLLRTSGVTRLALALDQLDEVLAADPRAAAGIDAFVRELTAARGRPPAVSVVVTVRETFRDLAGAHTRTIYEAWDARGTVVGKPTAAQLELMIREPLRTVGCVIDEALVTQIITDTRGSSSALPLAEETLSTLYERQRAGRLVIDEYQDVGGVAGALTKRANEVVARSESLGYDPRGLLVQLVRPDDPAGEREPQDVRRVAGREDLDERQWATAEHLAEARLVVTTGGDGLAGSGTAELAHQVLIDAWPRLRDWVEESREFRVWQEDLRTALHRWRTAAPGRERRLALLSGTGLRDAVRWSQLKGEQLPPHERDFVRAAVRHRAARRRRLAAAIGAVAVVLAVVAGFLLDRNARLNERREVAAAGSQLLARAQRETSPTLALRLGAAALALRPDSASRSALVSALSSTHYAGGLPGTPSRVSALAYAPGGGMLATSGSDGSLILWDLARARAVRRLSTVNGCAPGTETRSVAFSRNGRTLAQLTRQSWACLWDVRDPASPRLLSRVPTSALVLAFGPDGGTLALGDGKTVKLMDVKDPARPVTLSVSQGHRDVVVRLAYSADGSILASARDGVILWDVTRPRRPVRLATIKEPRYLDALAISPKGDRLVAAEHSGNLIAWDIRDPRRPQVIARWTGHHAIVYSLAYSPDGTTVASAGQDRAAVLWDVAPATPVRRTTFSTAGRLGAVAFNPAGTQIATGEDTGVTTLWNVNAPAEPRARAHLPTGMVATARHGGLMAVAGEPSLLYDLTDPARPRAAGRLPCGQADTAVAVSPDGSTVATAPLHGPVSLWDAADPARPRLISTIPGRTGRLVFSPDGRTLAVNVGLGSEFELWSIADRGAPAFLSIVADPAQGRLTTMAFGRDGRTLAVGGPYDVSALWDITDPARPRRTSPLPPDPSVPPSDLGPPRMAEAIAFSPGRDLIAVGDNDGTVLLWDVTDPARPRLATRIADQTSQILSIDFSPDGRMLAAGSYDRTLMVWDLTDVTAPQRLTAVSAYDDDFRQTVFGPDAATLVTVNTAGARPAATVRDVSALRDAVRDPRGVACDLAGELTPTVWARMLPAVPFRHTCSGLPG